MTRVAVGVPTYNGEAYLRECLDCLTRQTYSDLEILVCDNASTDGTELIVSEFAAKFSNVRRLRADHTIPAQQNFKRVYEETTAPYFMWRADDDLSSDTYVADLAAALDAAPDADLVVSQFTRCVEGKETVFNLPDLDTSTRASKVADLLEAARPTWIYGLWRRGPATEAVWPILDQYPYDWASDHAVMLPTILRGAVAFAKAESAMFWQNIVRNPTYILPPEEKLVVRKLFRSIAVAELARLDYDPDEVAQITKAIDVHVERRVAPKAQTTRRAIKAKLRRLVGF